MPTAVFLRIRNYWYGVYKGCCAKVPDIISAHEAGFPCAAETRNRSVALCRNAA
jgi:hypothetical protein